MSLGLVLAQLQDVAVPQTAQLPWDTHQLRVSLPAQPRIPGTCSPKCRVRGGCPKSIRLSVPRSPCQEHVEDLFEMATSLLHHHLQPLLSQRSLQSPPSLPAPHPALAASYPHSSGCLDPCGTWHLGQLRHWL